MASDDRLFDGLPSIRRPMAWETPGRSRQITSPQLSDTDSIHSADESFARMSSASGWRTIHSSASSPGPAGHRPIIEKQEQLRMYKEELAKKQRLIEQLTILETPRPSAFEPIEVDALSRPVEELAECHSRFTVLQAKNDALQMQIRELNEQLESRDKQLGELMASLEIAKQEAERHSELVITLRQHVADCDSRHSGLESAVSCAEQQLATVQQQYRDAQQRILQLEAQISREIEKGSLLEQQKVNAESQLEDLSQRLNAILGLLSVDTVLPSIEDITNKIERLIGERAAERNELELARSRVNELQEEQRNSRETIGQLSAQRDELQRESRQLSSSLNALKVDYGTLEQQLQQVRSERDKVRSHIDNVDKARSTAEKARDESLAKVAELERSLLHQDEKMRDDAERWSLWLQQVKAVLATYHRDSFETDNEFDVIEEVRRLVQTLQDKSTRIGLLEEKVSTVTEELNAVHRLEPIVSSDDLEQLHRRLQRAENELAAGDVLRDNLRMDREKFLRFIEQLSGILGVDCVSADVGLDGASDAVIVRAEQLAKNEATSVTDQKSQNYALKRKLKTMKEQLDGKDVHLELLRKKIVSLEERLTNKSEVERAKDEESVRSRKLMKLAEKYKRELNLVHVELRDLRARCLTTSEIQARATRQEHEITHLMSEKSRLEDIRAQHETAIQHLQDTIGKSTEEHGHKQDRADHTIHALTSELRTTKQALEDVIKREHQLVDLRAVIARMLGLSLDTLAVPDYELISRLEQLILANQANASTAVALESALCSADLGDRFQAGYSHAGRRLASKPRGVSGTSSVVVPPAGVTSAVQRCKVEAGLC